MSGIEVLFGEMFTQTDKVFTVNNSVAVDVGTCGDLNVGCTGVRIVRRKIFAQTDKVFTVDRSVARRVTVNDRDLREDLTAVFADTDGMTVFVCRIIAVVLVAFDVSAERASYCYRSAFAVQDRVILMSMAGSCRGGFLTRWLAASPRRSTPARRSRRS